MGSNLHSGQPAKRRVLLESIGVADTGDPRKDVDLFRVMPARWCSVNQRANGFQSTEGKSLGSHNDRKAI
jgi:hypothetical protein